MFKLGLSAALRCRNILKQPGTRSYQMNTFRQNVVFPRLKAEQTKRKMFNQLSNTGNSGLTFDIEMQSLGNKDGKGSRKNT